MNDPYRDPAPKEEPSKEDRRSEFERLVDANLQKVRDCNATPTALYIFGHAMKYLAFDCMMYYKAIAVAKEENRAKQNAELIQAIKAHAEITRK